MPANPELEIAYQIIGGIPGRQINLDDVVTSEGAADFKGRVACGVGWLLKHPRYQAQGYDVRLGERGVVEYKAPGRKNFTRKLLYPDLAAAMFNIPRMVAIWLFCPSHLSRLDVGAYSIHSHKRLLLRRIKKYLKSDLP